MPNGTLTATFLPHHPWCPTKSLCCLLKTHLYKYPNRRLFIYEGDAVYVKVRILHVVLH